MNSFNYLDDYEVGSLYSVADIDGDDNIYANHEVDFQRYLKPWKRQASQLISEFSPIPNVRSKYARR